MEPGAGGVAPGAADAGAGDGAEVSATQKAGSTDSRTVVVVTCRGKDGPGICDAFVRAIVDYRGRVLDMAQFLLEGSLVFTFVFDLGPQEGSMRVMTELLKCAQARGLSLEFYFPLGSEAPAAAKGHNEAVLSVVSADDITPALLYDMDTVLCEFGCVVHEIEHRSDNKAKNNGEYNKVSLRIDCPLGLRLSTLYMGAPQSPTGCAAAAGGLQKVGQEHGAAMTLRWWDATSRPNGKSLVVFELSGVLCQSDLLDELLKEAGVEPPEPVDGERPWQRDQRKAHELKGKSAAVEQRVVRRLQLNKGARLVCSALKALGFRLAVLTQTGMRAVSDHLRHALGIDYVICQHLATENGCYTGEYAGEASDVRFQKSDLLKLMAEREGIEFRNVILVGEFLKGLKVADARLMLETFGPNVHFNSAKMKDLSLALYVLGFSGSHVISLRRMFEPSEQGTDEPGTSPSSPARSSPSPTDGSLSFFPPPRNSEAGEMASAVVEVDARARVPGQLARAFAPLVRFRPQLRVSTLRQCGLQNGGMCLCMELQLKQEMAEEVLKECLYGCHTSGFHVTLCRDYETLRTPDFWSRHYFQNRYVITLVQKPLLASAALQAAFGSLSAEGVNVVKIERLSAKELAALQITVNVPEGLDVAKFSSRLVRVIEEHGADLAFQKDDVHRWMRRLIVFDMDSTLIQQEILDEVAKAAGVEQEAKKITESAMRGEIDFFESLKSRVQLLKDQSAEQLFKRVKEGLVYTPGAKLLCSTLKKLGYKMAVISGGFLPAAQEVQRHLGLDYAFANTLEVDERTGLLTGRTSGPIITPQRKRALLATIANVEGCKVQQTIAIGDGANDIPMLNTAGLGVAFCAKPKVQALTNFHINQKDLSTVLFLIGLSEHATERLGVADAER